MGAAFAVTRQCGGRSGASRAFRSTTRSKRARRVARCAASPMPGAASGMTAALTATRMRPDGDAGIAPASIAATAVMRPYAELRTKI